MNEDGRIKTIRISVGGKPQLDVEATAEDFKGMKLQDKNDVILTVTTACDHCGEKVEAKVGFTKEVLRTLAK